MLHLTFPNISHKSVYLEMIEEWDLQNHPDTNVPDRLFVGNNYEEFIGIITKDLTENEYGVNSSLFFYMNDADILGAIQIRHHTNHPNLSREDGAGGHIGYGLRPSARGKGLAGEMLELGLVEAQKLGITKVLISADEDNPASWKTIESCGGIYDGSIVKDGKVLKIYSINL